MTATLELPVFMQTVQDRCLERMEQVLPREHVPSEVIHQAMYYSVMAGGKRFRPALVVGTGRVFEAPESRLLDLACGVELIHTYSLIHDDLPCMDDDDLRRGKPTLHKVFGEDMAVLAGDALYALAFEVIARCGHIEIIAEIARATGTAGMIGGQVADVTLEGCDITPDDLEYIHRHKTGSLITACLTCAARLGTVTEEEIDFLHIAGRQLGLAFQIVDDILDETGDSVLLGKTPGSDRIRGKNTYPKLHGLEESIAQARRLVEEAKDALMLPERDTSLLRQLAEFVIHRVS